MKRLIALFVVALVVPILASAQPVRITPARVGQLVAALPSTCAVGDVVFLTTAPIGLHQAIDAAPCTWEALPGAGGGGGAITCLDTGVLFADGADSPACDAVFTYDKTTKTLAVGSVSLSTLVNNVRLVGLDNSDWDGASALGVVDVTGAQTDFIVAANWTDAQNYRGVLITALTSGGGTFATTEWTPVNNVAGTQLFDGRLLFQAGNGRGVIKVEGIDGVSSSAVLTAGVHELRVNETALTWNTNDFTVDSDGNGTFLTSVTAPAFISSGSGLAVANVGANSCGTTAATIAGGPASFEITVGSVGATQCRVTFPTAAPTRWNCTANNTTTANLARVTPVDTTNVDFLGTFVAGDVVSGVCIPR